MGSSAWDKPGDIETVRWGETKIYVFVNAIFWRGLCLAPKARILRETILGGVISGSVGENRKNDANSRLEYQKCRIWSDN